MVESAASSMHESRLWGLSAQQLHDAYWASHGVACVELGSGREPDAAADLYLLLEPGQAVMFDLRSLADSLLWNKAHVTRLRIVEPVAANYGEFLSLDGNGKVAKIERRYRAERRVSAQALLAVRLSDAAHWAASTTAAEARASMRRHRGLRLDSAECPGQRFDLANTDGRAGLMKSLVEQWPHPDQVLQGVVELATGIYGLEGSAMMPNDRCVAPLWIGSQPSTRSSLQCIGPAALDDAAAMEPVRTRGIDEIFSPLDSTGAARSLKSGGWYPPVKRAVDVTLSVLVLLLMSPILLVCCVAVVVDDGFPIFFGHRRQTKGGATFKCWKFRTMRRDAESRVAELRQQNLCDGPQVLIKSDPRVTRVGRIFRKLQLDEFPQFWNVICGDMSIVGPRPSPDNENQYCPAWREIRLSVRPGITGNWQVKRTREAGKDFQEWIRYDIEYVERMGPIFDLWLCILTVVNLLRRRGNES